MASISTTKNGRRRIDFTGPDGKRRTIRLGSVSKRGAESIKCRIENLLSAAMQGQEPYPADSDWLARIGDVLHDRIVSAGLCRARERAEVPTLAAMLAEYVDARPDVQESTRINYLQAMTNLKSYFGGDTLVDQITPADAEGFRAWMMTDQGLAQATVNRRVKRARQFFTWAVKKRYLAENPFQDVYGGHSKNRERIHYVSHDTIERILQACPDQEWRIIIALARYGGVRVPSEIVPLTWDCVLWSEKRIRIVSPKTAHQGRPERIIPLFPELAEVLSEAYDHAQPGEMHLVTRYRDKKTNLRTQFQRILKRADVNPWPRLFQNLRSSLAIDLADEYPDHVCEAWVGHTATIANAHYRTVTQEHFASATEKTPGKSAVESAVKAPHFPPLQASADSRKDSHKKRESHVNPSNSKAFRDSLQVSASPFKNKNLQPMTPRRLELRLPG